MEQRVFEGTGTMYTFGVFFKPLIRDFGWNRTELSGVFSIYIFTMGISGLLIGQWIDKYGARPVMIWSGITTGASLLTLSLTKALWHLYILYIIMGIGMAGITIVPVTTVLSHWFIKKRGTAIGIAMGGVGLGSIILVPLANHFISSLGWRISYIILGSLFWVIVLPAVALLIKRRPEDIGLSPDGEQVKFSLNPGYTNHSKRWTLKEVVRTRIYWILALAFFLVAVGVMGILVHLIPFMTDRGISAETASAILGFTIGVSLLGRIGFGFLADRIDKRHVLMICYSLQVIGILFLLGANSIELVYIFALIYGISYGGDLGLEALLVGEYFGRSSFGTIWGSMMIAVAFGNSCGPALAGYLFDITKDYYWAFYLFLGAYIWAILCILLSRHPKLQTL